MKKFLVLFLIPILVLDDWMKKDSNERKEMEEKMKIDWNAWMEKNKKVFVDMPRGAGKTKKITSEGVSDTRNDIMMYAVVEAESHDTASAMFVGHPHLTIPEATIEVLVVNEMQ